MKRSGSAFAVIAAVLLAAAGCSESGKNGLLNPGTNPSLMSDVVLVGAGNIASCGSNNDEATAKLVDSISGTVTVLGDNAFPAATLADYQNCYQPTWGRFKSRTRPVPGNHEYDSSTTAQGYFDYFGDAAGPRGLGYYSYDIGAWHIIVLNDNDAFVAYGAGSAQEAWLRQDLASTSQRCILAMWHVPLFISAFTPGYYQNDGHRILWNDLYAARADIVLNGHMHQYERMARMRPDGTRDDSTGILQINVGTGGESVAMPTVVNPNSQSLGAAFGVLKLTLKDGSYTWQFVPVAGQSFTDTGSGTCHKGQSANQLPVARAGGPYTSEDVVSFDGTASADPDNDLPLSYAWDFGDGATGTGPTPWHTYAAFGTYTATLVVTDARGGASAPATAQVNIQNIPPTVNAGGDRSATAGIVSLSATFHDPGANDAPWSWTIDWGDGLTSTGSTTNQSQAISSSHPYLVPGAYSVRVTVADKYGASGSAGFTLTITVL